MGGRGGAPNAGPGAATSPATPANAAVSRTSTALEAVQQAIAAEPARSIATLEAVRQRMAAMGISGKTTQDAQILLLARARQIVLSPVSNQKLMSRTERDARIEFGGELMGHVMMA